MTRTRWGSLFILAACLLILNAPGVALALGLVIIPTIALALWGLARLARRVLR